MNISFRYIGVESCSQNFTNNVSRAMNLCIMLHKISANDEGFRMRNARIRVQTCSQNFINYVHVSGAMNLCIMLHKISANDEGFCMRNARIREIYIKNKGN